MNQQHSTALDDYFGALLEEGSAEVQAKSEPAPITAPILPYAEPDEAERRQALESLLARVAELKEEETVAVEPEVAVKPQARVEPEPALELKPVAEPNPAVEPTPVAEPVSAPSAPAPAAAPTVEIDAQLAAELAAASADAEWRNMDTENSFQVLFFEVAGMTFAVPLTHLGGIYQVSKLTSLFGKPDWFAGVQTERERQVYVVDTARWAMPGHTAKEEYEYLVTLGESNWALGCHHLKGTALLTREQIKWRVTPGARPWLAGMVKEKMCALLHVDALIGLLEQGKNIDGQQSEQVKG